MIGFAGLSHLGVVSGIATASRGYKVLAYDRDPMLCSRLSAGDLPIFEPGLPEVLAGCQSQVRFIDDAHELSKCNLIFFSADVPTDKDNRSDLSSLYFLIDKVVSQTSPGTVLVILSQVPPGFTRTLAGSVERRQNGRGLQVFYQVETLIFGCAVERALHPERHIVGCGDPHRSLPGVYREWLKTWNCPLLVMSYESAELAKIAINIYLAASIGIANTLSELCEIVGANWSHILPALKLDRRIGPHAYLAPGLGLGGGNIERDLATARSVALEHGIDGSILAALVEHSRNRRNWVIRALQTHVMSRHPNPTLAIWGLSYKPGTKSTRNSPSLALLESLNGFSIRIYDPQATLAHDSFPRVTQVSSPLAACEEAHALIIMTAWEEFTAIPPSALHGVMSGSVVIDPAGAWKQSKAHDAGFLYCGFGAPATEPAVFT